MSDPSTPSAAAIEGFAVPDRARSRLQLRAVFAAGIVLTIVLLGFLMGLSLGVRGTDVWMLGLALVTFAVGCIPLVLDQGRAPEDRHVFLAMVALIYMSHFVVPALMVYIPATGPIDASSTANTNLMPADVLQGQLMALLGLVSLLVAYSLPIGSALARMLPAPRFDWSLSALLLVSMAMLGVGWLLTASAVFGLIPAAAGSGFIGVLGSWRTYAAVPLTYAYLRHGSKLAGLLIVGNLFLLFLMGVATSQKREMLIGPAVVVLTSTLLTKKIRARWVVAGFMAIIVIYPISVFVRDELLRTGSVADLITHPLFTLQAVSQFASGGEVGEYLEIGFKSTAHRIDGLGIASVIVRDTPAVSPFQYGRTLGLFFAAFIPRILWPDKPTIYIGQWITDVYGSGPHIDSRTAPTPIGEFYLNFGVLGVVLGLALFGIVFRLAHAALGRRGITAASILAQVVVLVILGIEFSGSVARVYSQMVFTLVSFWMIHLFVRGFTRTVPLGSQDAKVRPP